MLHIQASGSPYEIGRTHGTLAAAQVAGSLSFYASFFRTTGGRDWDAVRTTAAPFAATIEANWKSYHDEMRGIADGAGLALMDIIALNVRTEIAFGMFSDGCTTAFARNAGRNPLMGQNWDWQPEQKANLIRYTVAQAGHPTLDILTEAGIIGKIGLNSAGVGVCLNALRVAGADPTRLPVHLALRRAVEAPTRTDAVAALEGAGLASAAYILVGDREGATGLECSYTTLRRHEIGADGLLAHANHMVCEHGAAGDRFVEDHAEGKKIYWPDSLDRLPRMQALLTAAAAPEDGTINEKRFSDLFLDEEGFPASICRLADRKTSHIETLFNIVMDLGEKRATVKVGRPNAVEEVIYLGTWSASQDVSAVL